MFIKTFLIQGIDFFKQIYLNRNILYELIRRDFRTNYITNIFGLSWAIIEPLAMMTILWVVFTFLRSGQNIENVPFPLFLLTGLVMYDYFNKIINSGTRSIRNYAFLISKVNFRIAIIPLVKIVSELIIHMIILGIVAVIIILNGQPVTFYWLQVFYYLFAAICLLTGISWFTSSISLFFPDINYIITIVMRVLFFFTPIFWTADRMPANFKPFFMINPLYYLVNGYRDSMLFGVGFWEKPMETLYYWCFTGTFLLLGVVVFKKLRPHFADVI